jgi:cellulose synthase/poly-beta-1,6-N-acetylglucosamine synthase-like glycosyltransferase/peptidoglycan/xylan/chitin deacetylase (PgdA/CDA1 family)/spore germination protein YaaH
MLSGLKLARWLSLALFFAMTSSTMSQFKHSALSARASPFRFAFMDSTSPAARAALAQHIDELDGLIGEWLSADAKGNLSELEDPDQNGANIAATLKTVAEAAQHLEIIALISDEPGKHRAFAHLSNPKFRSKLERQIGESARKYDFDGILVNFEDPTGVDETALHKFIDELHAQFAPMNKKVGVVVPGDFPIDYAALASLSDLVVVELFNEGISKAGPLSPRTWWQRAAEARSASIPPEKLIFAIASTGRDWSEAAEDHESQPMSFDSLMLAASFSRATISFDPISGNPHFTFADSQDHLHDVWFLDAVTCFNQINRLAELQPRALALWELGAEDQSIWSVFNHVESGVRSDPSGLEDIPSNYMMARIGKGEVYRFLTRAKPGHRSIHFGDGEIDSETYRNFPSPWEAQVSGFLSGAIVLTFDDGPDPEYTERVLDILQREHLKATFFVTGLQSLKHPGTIRRIVREGHELGNHSFTHPDLSKLPDFLVQLELNATQRLLQVLTGRSVRVLRPPYAADQMADSIEEAHVLEVATRLGYVAIGANLNPDDWSGIPAQEIIHRVLEKAQSGAGSVIELHDAGGDRTNTVEALPGIIETLRRNGFRFVQVSELLGPNGSTSFPVSEDSWLWVAKLGLEGMSLAQKIFIGMLWTCIVLSSLRFLLLLVCAIRERMSRRVASAHSPAVSVLIAAYNEEKVIARTLESILASNYPGVTEVIVVDDGSTDGTSCVAQKARRRAKRSAFAHGPGTRVRVLRKQNGGKAEALNFAVEHMRTEIAVMLDADTCLQANAIRYLVRHFDDPAVGAVAGNAKVGNRINVVTKLQALEYVTSQNLERAGLAKLNAITVVPGAVGAWRREAVLRAGGFTPATLAEDCDLTFCLHRLGYKIVHDMEAIGWTEAPETWRGFSRQRFRWIYGTLQAAYRHSNAILHPSCSCGGFALLTLPSVVLFSVILPLISPVLDLFLVMAIVNGTVELLMHPQTYNIQAVTWGIFSYLYIFLIDLTTAVLAFALEPKEDRRLIAYLPLQRICYRQLFYVIILRALMSCLRGNAQGWNKLARVGSVNFGSLPESLI